MKENEAINSNVMQQNSSFEELDINVESLVQEELKFSQTQPSKEKLAGSSSKQMETIALPLGLKSKDELLQDIVLSLAMEQRAVAQFIQAEAKHMNAYIGVDRQSKITEADHQAFQSHLVRIVEGIVEKQKLSMRLLEMTKTMMKEG